MNLIQKELRRRTRKDFAPDAILAAPIGNDGAVSYCSPHTLAEPDGVDEKECSVAFRICTSDEDREGDVIDPKGCMDYLDEYRANPVVLYEHNAELGAIGMSKSRAGHFDFRIDDDCIIARCYYHMRPFHGENISAECFELAKRGVLLGASVGFLPLQQVRRSKGYKFTKWRLTEWSQTFQPVNQGTLNEDALRMSLSRGYVKSMSLVRRINEILPAKALTLPTGGSVPAGEPRDAKNMKPKTKSVAFDRKIFTTKSLCESWLASRGYDSSLVEEFPDSFLFIQRDGAVIPGSQKSLGSGVTAYLTKAMKADEDDEDEDETMDEVKVEKSDDEDEDDAEEMLDEDATDDDQEVSADEAAADAEVDEDAVEQDDEVLDEEPVEPDANANKSELEIKEHATRMAMVIDHFGKFIEFMESETPGDPEDDAVLHAAKEDAKALADSLRKLAKTKYGDHYLEQSLKKDDTPEQEFTDEERVGDDDGEMDMDVLDDAPDDIEPEDEDQFLKSLLSITSAVKSIRTEVSGIRPKFAKTK